MKIKKLIAFLLASAMLFSTFVLTVFAAGYYWTITGDKAELTGGSHIEEFFGKDKLTNQYGDGTPNTPFLIQNQRHLYNLSRLNAIGYLSKKYYYKVENDIDISAYTLSPIGSAEYPFYGDIDCGGKTISGAAIASGTFSTKNGWSEYDDIGFFGFIAEGANVYNLVLDNPVIVSGVYGTTRSSLDSLTASSFTLAATGSSGAYTALLINSGSQTDYYFKLETSDKTVLPASYDPDANAAHDRITTVTPKTGTTASIVVLSVLACKTENGVEATRILARYSVTVSAAGAITSYTPESVELEHKDKDGNIAKHIGLFAGHIDGSANNISVYGGELQTTLKNHFSQNGLIGFINTDTVGNSNLNNSTLSGDTGHLYAGGRDINGNASKGSGGLLNQIGTELSNSVYYEGAPIAHYSGTNPVKTYLTGNTGGTNNTPFASGSAASGWTLTNARRLEGFGPFTLVSGRSTNATISTITSISTLTFRGVYNVSVTSGNNGGNGTEITSSNITAAADYPSNNTVIDLSSAYPSTNSDSAVAKRINYLRAQIVDPFSLRRITTFTAAFRFNEGLANNNAQSLVNKYTGIATGNATTQDPNNSIAFNFTVAPSATTPVDVIVIASSRTASNAALYLKVASNTNPQQMPGICYFNTPGGGALVCYVFRFVVSSSYNFAFTTTSGNGGSASGAQFHYVAVGGQDLGVATGAEVIENVDFVYKVLQLVDGVSKYVIVPVTQGNYDPSQVLIEILFKNEDGVYSNSSVYFRRINENEFYVYCVTDKDTVVGFKITPTGIGATHCEVINTLPP